MVRGCSIIANVGWANPMACPPSSTCTATCSDSTAPPDSHMRVTPDGLGPAPVEEAGRLDVASCQCLGVSGTAADAWKAACGARYATRSGELAARATADAGQAAVTAKTATGAIVLASPAAVAVAVAATPTGILLKGDCVGSCRCSTRQGMANLQGRGDRDQRTQCPDHHQGLREG